VATELDSARESRRYYYNRLKATECLAKDMANEFESLFEQLEEIAPERVLYRLQGELMSLRVLADKTKKLVSEPDEAQTR
jgi:uncharacterized protein YpbB